MQASVREKLNLLDAFTEVLIFCGRLNLVSDDEEYKRSKVSLPGAQFPIAELVGRAKAKAKAATKTKAFIPLLSFFIFLVNFSISEKEKKSCWSYNFYFSTKKMSVEVVT